MIDPFSNQYRYTYTPAGRIDSVVIGGGGVREHRSYDLDGREFARQRVSATLGGLNFDTLRFDARGRVMTAWYSTRANGAPSDSTYLYYTGLGAVLARERREPTTSNWETEEFRVDALGNVVSDRAGNATYLPAVHRVSTYSFRGALNTRSELPNASWPLENDTLVQVFDLAGQTVLSHHRAHEKGGSYSADAPSRSYYGRDGTLRAVQRYNFVPGSGGDAGTFEEYRYDALGRRVAVIARQAGTLPGCSGITICSTLCTVGDCYDKTTLVVWDGSSILREERRPYPDGAISGAHFGIIENIHGLELDHPLAVSDQSSARVLNANWRGLFESSVTPSGAAADCSLGTGSCTHIMWPAGQPVYARTPPVETGTIVYTFAGNLVTDQQDASGHLFRRNRYYDPMAGRFTQEDPIGMAGGLNVYGFASGDPVNSRDPFGLCPPKDQNVQDCEGPQYWREQSVGASSTAARVASTVMAGLAAIGESVVAEIQGLPVGDCGTKYVCGTVPDVGPGGEGLLGAILFI